MYDDEYDYTPTSEEAEFNRSYYGNLMEHVCEGCDAKFKAPAMRGPLAYCDSCADIIERGGEVSNNC